MNKSASLLEVFRARCGGCFQCVDSHESHRTASAAREGLKCLGWTEAQRGERCVWLCPECTKGEKRRQMITSCVSIHEVLGGLEERPVICQCCGGEKFLVGGPLIFYICFHDSGEGHGRGAYVCFDCLRRGVVHGMNGVRDMLPGER